MNTLSVNIFESPGAVVIRLEGDAGLQAADGLQIPFQRIVGARPPLVVFDVEKLNYAASLFLGLMVSLRRGVVSQGGRVQMAGVQSALREVLQMTRLAELFEFIPAAPALAEPTPAARAN